MKFLCVACDEAMKLVETADTAGGESLTVMLPASDAGLARHGDLMAEDSNCPYVRPAGALPEAAPAILARREELTWEPAAEALLERMPAFIRGRVKARLEEFAVKEVQRLMAVDFMRAHRPPLRFPVCPSGNPTGTQWPK
jgi:predicted DCC family thiol-disulfide oxidoreductase YuxK